MVIVEKAMFSGTFPAEDDTMYVMAYVSELQKEIYASKNIFGKLKKARRAKDKISHRVKSGASFAPDIHPARDKAVRNIAYAAENI